jgi:SulP family sulfate permease
VGIILALLNFMRRMSSSVEVREMDEIDMAAQLPAHNDVTVPEGVLVYTVDGPFFFGAVDQFEQALLHTHTAPHALVVSLERVPFIDLTGLQSLEEVITQLKKRGIAVTLCCANDAVAARLEKAGISATLAASPAVPLAEAIASVQPAK